MKLAKQILGLVAERDNYKRHADTQSVLIRKQVTELEKYKACVEALYKQRENGTAAIVAEHLGPKWGVNFEMRDYYSAPLKQQLEVSWPIHTARSSSKSMNSDGEPQEASGEKMKGPAGCGSTSYPSAVVPRMNLTKTPEPSKTDPFTK